MALFDIGSAIGAAIDQATQLTTTGLNMWNTWRTNEQAYDQSKKLWNLNNEYNKPINQMKRLEEAGLNPFLVYGNGATGNTSAQPSSPSVQGSKFQLNPIQSILFGKELQKMNLEKKALQTKNDILEYQLGNLRYNSRLFKDAGLPTTASWWSPSLFGLFRNPKNVNMLKGLGLSIGEIIQGVIEAGQPKPKYIDPNEINLEWNKNGVVSREVLVEN